MKRLRIFGYGIYVVNFIFYLCLFLSDEGLIKYNLFHETVLLTDYKIIFIQVFIDIMFFLLLVSYFWVDTEASPMFSVFKLNAKIDFAVRFCVVVITFILLRTIITINNAKYLYIIIFGFFILNIHFENKIWKNINNTNDVEIKQIEHRSKLIISKEQIDNYKNAYKNGKRAFFVIISVVIFSSVLTNLLTTIIFFLIYSVVVYYLLLNMYFLLYRKNKAIRKLIVNSFFLMLGFVLVILLNEKVINLIIFNFSKQELISIVSFFTFPLYSPVRKVYLSLKHSDNLINSISQDYV